jgi:hypothetical protein
MLSSMNDTNVNNHLSLYYSKRKHEDYFQVWKIVLSTHDMEQIEQSLDI